MNNVLARIRRRYELDGTAGVIRAFIWRVQSPAFRAYWAWAKRQGHERVRSAYGVWLAPFWHDATFQFCLQGLYGLELAKLLESHDRDFLFIDIGANQGLYSILAAKNRNCVQVIALEPVQGTYAMLVKNIELNRVSDGITPLRWAISDFSGVVTINKPRGHTGRANMRADSGADSDREMIEVHTFKELAPYLPEGVSIFVKIDVEGHELAVMRAIIGAESYHPQISDIFYEVDEHWVEPAKLTEILVKMGFSNTRIIGKGVHYDVHASRD